MFMQKGVHISLQTQMETPMAPVREWSLLAPRAASLAAACITPEGYPGFYLEVQGRAVTSYVAHKARITSPRLGHW